MSDDQTRVPTDRPARLAEYAAHKAAEAAALEAAGHTCLTCGGFAEDEHDGHRYVYRRAGQVELGASS